MRRGHEPTSLASVVGGVLAVERQAGVETLFSCSHSRQIGLIPTRTACWRSTLASMRLHQVGAARKCAGRWRALGGEFVYREVAARRWCAGSTPCRHWSCVVRRPVRVGSGPTWGSLSDVGGRRVTDAAEASILRHRPGVYAEEIRIIILMRSKSINERHE
jgi:hypothetical protein